MATNCNTDARANFAESKRTLWISVVYVYGRPFWLRVWVSYDALVVFAILHGKW